MSTKITNNTLKQESIQEKWVFQRRPRVGLLKKTLNKTESLSRRCTGHKRMTRVSMLLFKEDTFPGARGKSKLMGGAASCHSQSARAYMDSRQNRVFPQIFEPLHPILKKR